MGVSPGPMPELYSHGLSAHMGQAGYRRGEQARATAGALTGVKAHSMMIFDFKSLEVRR